MNDTTRELLLKTRKGSTASFERLQWSTILAALGFEVFIEKTRNTVTKYVVKAASGETLTIEKEPNYKRISFYKLGRWLKSIDFDLVAASSKALGLDTPEVEKKLKDLYVRDLTNTGTCAVCQGNFKRNGTGIGHHGFVRPGDGMLHGQCFGVGHLPWDCSSYGAEAYILFLKGLLLSAQSYLEKLPSHTSMIESKLDGSFVEITRAVDSTKFERLLAEEIRQTERKISSLTYEIEAFTVRVANWKPDELPEVKHAGKFKVA